MHRLLWGGIWSEEIIYISDYELVNMPSETFIEFKRLISELGDMIGVEVTYEPRKHRYCICCLTPVITNLPPVKETS